MNELMKAPETGIAPAAEEHGSLAVSMARAELDQAIVTARQFPRSLSTVKSNILSLATLDEQTAEECIYALPRGGKPIRGPSVRLAEIIAAMYGNCHVASRVVAVDRFDKVVIAEGVFWDLETGLRRTAQVRRRITDKNGRLYNDDMIVVTGNAACSIALREAILKGVPKALWREAYDACDRVIAGDVKTVNQRRAEAFKAFAAFGVTPEMIFDALEIGGEAEVDLDQLATLKAMYKAVRDGETPVEEYFPALAGGDGKRAAPAKGGKNLKDMVDADETVDQETGEVTKKADGKKQAEKPKQETTAKDDPEPAGDPRETPPDDQSAGDGESDPEPTDDAGQDAVAVDPDALTDDERTAYDKGVANRAKGMARTVVPKLFNDNGPLAAAYVAGWDGAGD